MRSVFAFGLLSSAAAEAMTPSVVCAKSGASAAWCDHTKPTAERVGALIAELTNAEKSVLFVNGAGAVPRLDIPKYGWWSEALHGTARDGLATSFPQIIGVASSYNHSLFQALGEVTGTEARGKNNGKASWPGDGGMYHGLTMWAPNVNIFRDPRWGRGQETPGEDPTLNGAYAEQFIGGMQGDESATGYLRTSACLKHYAAYSEEQGRNSFPAVVTPQDMVDTVLRHRRLTCCARASAFHPCCFAHPLARLSLSLSLPPSLPLQYLPAFQQGIQKGKASGLMCSYNAETYGSGIYGPGTDEQHGAIPSCANKGLLNDLLRDKWGFKGYITSE